MKNLIGLVLTLVAVNLSAQEAWYNKLITFNQHVSEAKQLTITAYPSYAPGLVNSQGKSAEWGFGLAGFYPVLNETLNGHVQVGLRLDYLSEQWWTPSAVVTPSADFQLFGHNFTAFGIAGAIAPLQNAGKDNFEVGATLGAGVYTTLWQFNEKSSLQGFVAYERWTPVVDRSIYHLGLAFTARF